jgi:lipid-binding SYLF domain-containing protein
MFTRACRNGTIALAASLVIASTAAFAGDAKPSANDGQSDEAKRVEQAAEVVIAATTGADAAIPRALLQEAKGIAVIPHVVKGALGVGGRWGKGVVASRTAEGTWSAPAFVSIGGASYGFQIGVEATDLILVFTDPKGIQALLDDKVKLGADAGVTAGPIGRKAETGVNLTLDAAIYSYSRSKGLFAGIALDGAVLDVDQDANARVYGKDVKAKQLLNGKVGASATVQPFMEAMADHVPMRQT